MFFMILISVVCGLLISNGARFILSKSSAPHDPETVAKRREVVLQAFFDLFAVLIIFFPLYTSGTMEKGYLDSAAFKSALPAFYILGIVFLGIVIDVWIRSLLREKKAHKG